MSPSFPMCPQVPLPLTFPAALWARLCVGAVATAEWAPHPALPHPGLTRTAGFPLVNSLKASVTCSRVLVFLKSRFTEPSSF